MDAASSSSAALCVASAPESGSKADGSPMAGAGRQGRVRDYRQVGGRFIDSKDMTDVLTWLRPSSNTTGRCVLCKRASPELAAWSRNNCAPPADWKNANAAMHGPAAARHPPAKARSRLISFSCCLRPRQSCLACASYARAAGAVGRPLGRSPTATCAQPDTLQLAL
jgi:hypothetical protein